MPPSNQTQSSWMLDKKVPAALLIAMLIQAIVMSATASFWFAKMDSRIANLEEKIIVMSQITNEISELNVRLVRLEERYRESK